jgi:hypothetical protein
VSRVRYNHIKVEGFIHEPHEYGEEKVVKQNGKELTQQLQFKTTAVHK